MLLPRVRRQARRAVDSRCQLCFEVVGQRDALHLNADLLQLLNRLLDFEDGGSVLDAGEPEVALHVREHDVEVKALLVEGHACQARGALPNLTRVHP